MILVPLLLTVFGIRPAVAEPWRPGDRYLDARVWVELNPMFHETDEYPRSVDTARAILFEEVRFGISGMLYGFRVVYEPGSRDRGIPDEVSLAPIATIPLADPSLHFADTQVADERLYARVTYDLSDSQSARLESWHGIGAVPIGAAGTASTLLGDEGRRRAVTEAVRLAVRSHFQRLVNEQPRRVAADILFVDLPRVSIRSGEWVAGVSALIRNEEITANRVY